MPLGNTHTECLRHLGVALKAKASPGEQFCVFAFDCKEFDSLVPRPASITKAELPFTDYWCQHPPIPNWNAAFYSIVGPTHTERAILAGIKGWISYYETYYGRLKALYIYSRLVPCLRDGCRGHCSDQIAEFMLWTKVELNQDIEYHIGWGNDDRDPDMAWAIKVAIADMEDDGISVHIYPKISIA